MLRAVNYVLILFALLGQNGHISALLLTIYWGLEADCPWHVCIGRPYAETMPPARAAMEIFFWVPWHPFFFYGMSMILRRHRLLRTLVRDRQRVVATGPCKCAVFWLVFWYRELAFKLVPSIFHVGA